MKSFFVLFFVLLFSSFFSLAKKKDKWVLVHGILVDTMGYAIPGQNMGIVNAKGFDKKTVIETDLAGNFTFRIKRKHLDNYSIKSYSNIAVNKIVKVKDMLGNNNFVLNTNYYYVFHRQFNFLNKNEFLIRLACGSGIFSGCRYYYEDLLIKSPFNSGDVNEILRSHYGMVK